MQSNAIASIEAPVAGPQVSAEPKATTGMSGESVFSGIIQAILQRGSSPGDTGTSEAAPGIGTGVASGAMTGATRTSRVAASSATLSAAVSGVNGSLTAPTKPASQPDNLAAVAASVSSQAVAGLRNVALDLGIGKNVAPSSPVLAVVADAVAKSAANETADGKLGVTSPADFATPTKLRGSAQGITNSASKSRVATRVQTSSALALNSPVNPPAIATQPSLSLGATNVSVSAPNGSAPSAAVAVGANSLSRGPSGSTSGGVASFASGLATATAVATSTTSFVITTAQTPISATDTAPHLSDVDAQPTADEYASQAKTSPASRAAFGSTTQSQPATPTPFTPLSTEFALDGSATPNTHLPGNSQATLAAASEPTTTSESTATSQSNVTGMTQPAPRNAPANAPALLQAVALVQSKTALDAQRLPDGATNASASGVVAQPVTQKDGESADVAAATGAPAEALAAMAHSAGATPSTNGANANLVATHGAAAQRDAIGRPADNSHTSRDANSQQNSPPNGDATIAGPAGTTRNGAADDSNTPADGSGVSSNIASTPNQAIANVAAANGVTANADAASSALATVPTPLAVPFAPHAPTATPSLAQPSATTPDLSGAQTAATPSLPASPDAAARGAFVSTAQLGQSGTHSEMRVSLQSDNLGAIELHARVSGDSVGAAITVEKRDAHTMLATELPALQQALSDKQLRVEQITLLHAPMSATSGDAGASQFGGAGQGQTGGRGTQNSASSGFGAMPLSGFSFSAGFSADAGEIFDAQGRLSVHA